MTKKKIKKYNIKDHEIDPYGKIHVGIPRERFYMPEFVDNRDAIMNAIRSKNRGNSIYQQSGHRVDRNRDAISMYFLNNTDAEWLLMLDSDMEHPVDIGMRLTAWGKPIVGGLYFHRNKTHDPFCFEKGEVKYVNDRFGREKQQWIPMRDLVYDFLVKYGVPMRDGSIALGKPGEVGLVECDGVATGAMVIHRSVLEHMLEAGVDLGGVPWFEYVTAGSSEDLQFCLKAKEDFGIPIHCDLSTISGHYVLNPVGQGQFRTLYEGRGVNLSLYSFNDMAKILGGFLDIPKEDALKKIQKADATMVGSYWNSKEPSTAEEIREFYKDKHTGWLYLLELIHWNTSPVFDKMKKSLMPYRGMNVVEIGSGIGSMAIQMSLQHCDVIGVETNDYLRSFAEYRWEYMQGILEGKHGDIKFVGDQEWRTIPSETVNIFIGFDVFEHLAEEDAEDVIREASRLLKPGGLMLYHNNWRQQDLYPMHFDYSDKWSGWLKKYGLVESSPFQAYKPNNPKSQEQEDE